MKGYAQHRIMQSHSATPASCMENRLQLVTITIHYPCPGEKTMLLTPTQHLQPRALVNPDTYKTKSP